jgi:hypothetical protein
VEGDGDRERMLPANVDGTGTEFVVLLAAPDGVNEEMSTNLVLVEMV